MKMKIMDKESYNKVQLNISETKAKLLGMQK